MTTIHISQMPTLPDTLVCVSCDTITGTATICPDCFNDTVALSEVLDFLEASWLFDLYAYRVISAGHAMNYAAIFFNACLGFEANLWHLVEQGLLDYDIADYMAGGCSVIEAITYASEVAA